MSKISHTRRRYVRFLVLALLAPVVACLAVGVRAARREMDVDFTPRPSRPTIPASSPLRAAATVTFDSTNGDRLSAWWLPGSRRISIVFVHGTDAARDQLLPEAEILSEFGYSVLLLDLPGHGESLGKILWGRTERLAIDAAVTFVSSQAPDAKVALYAFSAGAIVAAQAAASDARVRAVVFAGPPADFVNHIMGVYSRWGWLSAYPAIWGAYLAGYRNDGPTTVEAAAKIGAVMVVTGTADTIVPPAESMQVFEAAHQPKELLRVEGGRHGDYLQVMGRTAYAQALNAFFERHLGQ